MAMARALAWRNRWWCASVKVLICYAFIIVYPKRLTSALTHVSECFNTALNVGLLRSDEPGAVIDPEGRLEQLDEDGLVCLRSREDSAALLWL